MSHHVLESPLAVESANLRSRAVVAMVFCQLITGTTYIVAKAGLQEFSPFCLGFWRFLIAGVLFAVILTGRGEWRLPERADLPKLLMFAALGVPLNQGVFLVGIGRTVAAHGALLYASTPLIVFLLSLLLRQTAFSLRRAVGIGLGFTGVLCVLLEKGLSFSAATLSGDLLVALGVLFWSLYTLLGKQLIGRYSALYLTGFSMVAGAIMFLPVGLPAAVQQDYAQVSGAGVFSVLYLAILTSLVAYLIWNWALAYLEAEKVAVIANLQPVVAAIMGWLVLGETVTWVFFAGAALVLSGVWLTQKS